ncbi:hypothetical protein MTBBW1_50037 [Desulfamplus magnetovallimortis]|uniref:Uncharacterized protein n=1 Tax=Desulfamplus magnetovallimortis TaxID=1246637 RepID=A0A1W1HHF3_9BACT|nr:hypothetical protein MTBBW1_50037 [Desulfamplus magnetovallimortis]
MCHGDFYLPGIYDGMFSRHAHANDAATLFLLPADKWINPFHHGGRKVEPKQLS